MLVESDKALNSLPVVVVVVVVVVVKTLRRNSERAYFESLYSEQLYSELLIAIFSPNDTTPKVITANTFYSELLLYSEITQ